MTFALLLLTSLIVGMSSYYFSYPYFYWIGQSLTDNYQLAISLPRTIGFIIACICLVVYYKKMSFRRGILTALGIIIATFVFFVFGFTFRHGLLPTICLVLNCFAGALCSLLVTSAIAFHYFRKHCFLVIGCGAAVIQISNTLFGFIFNMLGNGGFILFAIAVSAAVFLLSLIFLPDIALDCDKKDGHEKPETVKYFLFIAIGMILFGMSAGFLLDLGNSAYAASGLITGRFYMWQDLAAAAGSLLFGYLADRYRLHRILLIYFITCICVVVNVFFAGPAILTFMGRGFGFTILVLISPVAAVTRSGDHYHIRSAGWVEAAYYLGGIAAIGGTYFFGF